jgi:hypothetical protein
LIYLPHYHYLCLARLVPLMHGAFQLNGGILNRHYYSSWRKVLFAEITRIADCGDCTVMSTVKTKDNNVVFGPNGLYDWALW